ncbi:OsmC family protein [Neptuniibacter sp. QD34_54]|uniref:OsmC family protein n=1 Tax=Neptuniibacter sp. QD34_54 TaxID=3398208 RepID=UPI0039F49B88
MSTKTISVTATMNAGWAIHADIRDHQVTIDQPQASGGTNEGPTPLEYFLFSLAGCIGSIARIAANQEKIELRSMQIQVDGDLNPMGLMGKETEDRVGFQTISVQAKIDADLSETEKQAFLDRVCVRCPLHDNIKLETEVLHQYIG